MSPEITAVDTRRIIRGRVIAKIGDLYPACEDVENETMYRLIKALNNRKFKGDSDIKTYIISITDCAIADYFRKTYKENPSSLMFLWDSFDDTLATVEVKEIIDESFKILSDEQRKVMILTETLGMSYDEAAMKIGITKGRLASIKADAKRKMKKHLVKMGFETTISLDARKKIEWLGKFWRAYESMCTKSNHGNAMMLGDARKAYEGIKERLRSQSK